eukprot:TRINITY_DN8827_c0_g1_i1.p1 TRINITY_DN8827_c0_g1~~TRINITY_DN8827_c0_g1_i1.p1  ORF type:complete len:416 (+),score=104.07 TRINITY_DN8827_c0_g1_i1:87-1250(+)
MCIRDRYKLDVDPSQHSVMLTEPLNTSPFVAASTASCMFEEFKVPALGMVPAAAMALYASGRETGIALDVGGGLVQVLPLLAGDPVAAADGGILKLSAHLGGADVTQRMARMLMPHRGAWLRSESELRLMENLKEQASMVCPTPQAYDEMEHDPAESSIEYTMPDGLTLSIGHERIKAAECLFRPELNMTEVPIQDYFGQCLSGADQSVLPNLLQNVVLCGGTTMTKGFHERTIWELSNTMGQSVRVLAKPERKYLAWMGASIVATLSTYNEEWLTSGEYEEIGESLVHRKGMFVNLRADAEDVLKDAFFDAPTVKQAAILKAPEPTEPREATAENLSLIHISEPTRLLSISYAVFCLKKKKKKHVNIHLSISMTLYHILKLSHIIR